MVSVASTNPGTPLGSPEAAIFQRKWHTAVTPAAPLPPYEEIVLGGLGRLGEHLVLIEQPPPQVFKPQAFKVLRCGRGLWDWVGSNVEQKMVDELPQEFAQPLRLVLDQALQSGKPVTQHSRRVRGGMVETFEFLALPLGHHAGRRPRHQGRRAVQS